MQEVSFDEVVAEWLKSEWHYPVYDNRRNAETEKVVYSFDQNNKNESTIRLKLLLSNRNDIIGKLPTDTLWYKANFTRKDVNRTMLINTTWCRQLTNGTCKLKDAIIHFESNLEKIKKEDADRISEIQESIIKGSLHNTKLIFIAQSESASLIVIEGNHRIIPLVKIALEQNKSEQILEEVYVGISSNFQKTL